MFCGLAALFARGESTTGCFSPSHFNDEPNTLSHSGYLISSHDGNPRIAGGVIFINRPKYESVFSLEYGGL